MSQARIHPPSEQRIAQARRAGHVPRAAITGAIAGLLGAALGLCLWGPRLWSGCTRLLRVSLEATANREPVSGAVWAAEAWRELGVPTLSILFVAWAAAGFFSFLAQGTALFVPSARARQRFPRLRPARTAGVLAALAVLVVCACVLPDSLRVNDFESGAALFVRWCKWLVAPLLACVVVDVALARARFFRSLWLTRREHLDDQKEAYGSPEIRAFRERIRREGARGGRA
jgi:flagellar biosynthesis protein FlhB